MQYRMASRHGFRDVRPHRDIIVNVHPKVSSTAASRSPPCDSAASCLLHCNSCPCAGYVSIRRRARPCGTFPHRVDVSRPQKLLAHSSSMSQRLGFEARSCYCVSYRRRTRPCAAVRARSPQFVSMRFNVRPCIF